MAGWETSPRGNQQEILNARRKKKFMDDGIGLGDRLGRMLRQ
jgi:hypothetical protein